MSGISKRVYQNRRNVDIGGGVDKSGLPSTMGIPTMLRRFVASRAPNGVNNIPVVPVNIPEPIFRQIKRIVGTFPQSNAQFGYDVAISGNYVVVGAPYRDNNDGNSNANTNEGSVYVFKINSGGTDVTQIGGRINDPNPQTNSNFGSAVAISGNSTSGYYVVVGAPFNTTSTSKGYAYVFKINSDDTITQIGGRLDGSQVNDAFGRSVAISGNYFVVGANRNNNFVGSVYVFKINSNDTVTQIGGRLDGLADDQFFGSAVAISGNYFVVGAPTYSKVGGLSEEGCILVFKINGDDTFTQIGERIFRVNPNTQREFGSSVAISGNYIVVSAPSTLLLDTSERCDTAFVYKINGNGTAVSLVGVPLTLNSFDNDWGGGLMGADVAISGNYIVVSRVETNFNSDYYICFVFKINSNDTFTTVNKITATLPQKGSLFGNSVAISGNYIVVGAPLHDNNDGNSNANTDEGSVYFFKN